MVKAGIRSLVLAVMLFFLGIGVEFGGTAVNRFVMERNDGKMPVWMINRNIALVVLLSSDHCPLNWETRYPFLADIIPQPIISVDQPGVQLALLSFGDVVVSTGSFLMCVALLKLGSIPFVMFRHRSR